MSEITVRNHLPESPRLVQKASQEIMLCWASEFTTHRPHSDRRLKSPSPKCLRSEITVNCFQEPLHNFPFVTAKKWLQWRESDQWIVKERAARGPARN